MRSIAMGRESTVFALDSRFDLAALVRAFRAAGWRVRRGKRLAAAGAVLDTPNRELLGAGLAAVEERAAGRSAVEVWVMPHDGGEPKVVLRASGRAAAVSPAEGPEAEEDDVRGERARQPRDPLAVMISKRFSLPLTGEMRTIARFKMETLPIELTSQAGIVTAKVETLSGIRGETGESVAGGTGGAGGTGAGAFLALESGSGARVLALAAGLARLIDGVGQEAGGGPAALLAACGLDAGPAVGGKFYCRKGMTAGEAAVRAIEVNYRRFIAQEPGARVGLDSEYVHDMRVAMRRMDAALDVFARAFKKGARDRMAAETRWFLGLLGAVRDIDTYIDSIPRYLSYLGCEPPEYKFYVNILKRRRDAAREELFAALESHRYGMLKAEMETFIRRPPLARRQERVKAVAREGLAGLASEIRKASKSLATDKELHRLRILFKRLRYAGEILSCVAPEKLTRLAREATWFQDVLGRHNDATVACGLVREAVAKDVKDRLHVFLLGYLLACQRLAAIDARREFFERWGGKGRKRMQAEVKAIVEGI